MKPGRVIRLALLIVWLVGSLWPSPSVAHAAPALRTAPAGSYLDQLLVEINARRDRAGTPWLAPAPERAREALAEYLAELTPRMLAAGSCFHGIGSPARSGWAYIADAGFEADARGEVIACPGSDGFWTAERIAEAWWSSAHHRAILFADARANVVACGTYGPQRGGAAYQTIACVTYRQ